MGRFPTRLEMIHSVHLKYRDPENALIKLMWRIGNSDAEAVPLSALFQSNSRPTLRISGLDPSLYDVIFLYDGEFAYKDSQIHYLADVPTQFLGAKAIRTVPSPLEEKVSFSITVPVTVYIATPMDDTPHVTPCKGILRPTEEILSVYESPSRTERARAVQYFTISEVSVPRAQMISFSIEQEQKPFLLFLVPSVQGGTNCGGQEIALSNPSSLAFQACEASSAASNEFSCQYGLNGMMMDQPFGTWRSASSNGVGEFVTIRFRSPVQLTKLRFKPLDDPVKWPAEFTLSFSERSVPEEELVFTVLHSSNLDYLTYQLDDVVTQYIKITISRMYVNGNGTGGSFELMGTACQSEDQEPRLGLKSSEAPDVASPRETVSSGTVNRPAIPNAETPGSDATPSASQYLAEPSSLETILVENCEAVLADFPQVAPVLSGRMYRFSCTPRCISHWKHEKTAPALGSKQPSHEVEHSGPSPPNSFVVESSQVLPGPDRGKLSASFREQTVRVHGEVLAGTSSIASNEMKSEVGSGADAESGMKNNKDGDEESEPDLEREDRTATQSRASDSPAKRTQDSEGLREDSGSKMLPPRVYGGPLYYSPESQICAAAIHSWACQGKSNEACNIIVEVRDGLSEFKGSLRNGVLSDAHGPTEVSLLFSPALESKPLDSNTAEAGTTTPFAVGVSFTSRTAQVLPGFLLDNGSPLTAQRASSNVVYGWDHQAKPVSCDSVALHDEQQESSLLGGIEFPPDRSAPECESGNMDCSPNTWTIVLPSKGLYKVEAQVGHPCAPETGAYVYFLQVNDQSLVHGEEFPKGEYYWATTDVFVGDDRKLVFTAECPSGGKAGDSRCSRARTTILNLRVSTPIRSV